MSNNFTFRSLLRGRSKFAFGSLLPRGSRPSGSERGFTLVEAIVAIMVFTLGVVGLVALITISKATSEQGRDAIQASNYIQEGLEAVRSVRDASWTNVATTGIYRLNPQPAQNPPWQLLTGGSETVGKYSRKVKIDSVRREDSNASGALDAGDKIVPSDGNCNDDDMDGFDDDADGNEGDSDDTEDNDGDDDDDEVEDNDGQGSCGAGQFDDPDTKKVTVTVIWQNGSRTSTRLIYVYLTKWQS